jgi:hypothetical protein
MLFKKFLFNLRKHFINLFIKGKVHQNQVYYIKKLKFR